MFSRRNVFRVPMSAWESAPPSFHNPNKDICVNSAAYDGITDLAWHRSEPYLVTASWDNNVRCYLVPPSGTPEIKACITNDGPVLSLCTGDNRVFFGGGGQNQVTCWDLATNECFHIGSHCAPISFTHFYAEKNCLLTASWDKTIRFWDTRASSPIGTVSPGCDRIYSGHGLGDSAIFATADRKVLVLDLRRPNEPLKTLESPLAHQTASIAHFTDGKGYAIGSIAGRVSIQYFDEASFTFKCHRGAEPDKSIHSVNVLDFHPNGAFVTAGSDGAYHFWDKDTRRRLNPFATHSIPISCGKFSPDGSMFGYALSYDWSKGSRAVNVLRDNHLMIHRVASNEIRRR